MPDLPIGSSAEPLRYHTMWVTTGARWSGITTMSSPLSRRPVVTAACAAGLPPCPPGVSDAASVALGEPVRWEAVGATELVCMGLNLSAEERAAAATASPVGRRPRAIGIA